MKRFNLTGVCVPEKHYMVDLSENYFASQLIFANGLIMDIAEVLERQKGADHYGKTSRHWISGF